MEKWKCTVCGHIHQGSIDENFVCPVCGQRKAFKPGDKPEATFCTAGSKPVAVYSYCNQHGLWKTEIK